MLNGQDADGPATRGGAGTAKGSLTPLDREVGLRLSGSFQGFDDFDLELPAGRGPEFSLGTDMEARRATEPKPRTIIRASVEKVNARYRVDYTITVGIPVATSSMTNLQGVTQVMSYDYSAHELKGTVLLKPGEPVPIVKVLDESLTVELREVK